MWASKTIKHKIYLDTLPLADGAAFDSHMNELSPVCHPDTRIDLFRRISEWSGDTKGKTIFWLNGKAGTGKSTISRTFARTLDRERRLAASFFFKRGEGALGTASRFFTTIAAQIALSIPSAEEHILAAVKELPLITEKTLGDQFLGIILSPLRKVPSSTPPYIIVVDALDECDSIDHIRTIIRLLSSSKMEDVGLRVFLTSRPDTPIRLGFNQISGGIYQGLILHDVAQETIRHDIHVVLQHELRNITQDHNSVVLSPLSRLPSDWPGSTNVDVLAEIACPLFISAATMCRFIGDRRFHPEQRLAALLKHQSSSYASRMQMTYLPILHQVLHDDLTRQEERYLVNCFQKVVGSIIVLAEPLSILQLARLLNIAETEVDMTLEPLHAVLDIRTDNTPVRLFHHSFRDFLLDEELDTKSPFCINGSQAHQIILEKSLARMCGTGELSGLRKNICQLEKPRKLNIRIKKETIERHLSGELAYACLYWVHHLEHTSSRIQDGDQVSRFLETHFLYWVEALALLGQTSSIVRFVQILLDHVDKVSTVPS